MIINRTGLFIKKLIIKLSFITLTVYLTLVTVGLLLSDALIFLPQPASYQNTEDLLYIPTETANKAGAQHNIIIRHLHNPNSKYTVLYSHGNAVDIGGLVNLQQKFFSHGYSVVIYDYSGYGLSEDQPSEQQVYNDAQAVYDYLTIQKNINPSQILSYGHSLGAAIATNLALNNPVAGLILENPFTTAFRVKTIYPIVPFDKFASIEKIGKIKSPLFITHSRDDRVISFWHGKSLFDKAKQPKTALWFDHQGHSNITHTDSFWTGFNAFTTDLN